MTLSPLFVVESTRIRESNGKSAFLSVMPRFTLILCMIGLRWFSLLFWFLHSPLPETEFVWNYSANWWHWATLYGCLLINWHHFLFAFTAVCSQPNNRLSLGTFGCWAIYWLITHYSFFPVNFSFLRGDNLPSPPPCFRPLISCSGKVLSKRLWYGLAYAVPKSPFPCGAVNVNKSTARECIAMCGKNEWKVRTDTRTYGHVKQFNSRPAWCAPFGE